MILGGNPSDSDEAWTTLTCTRIAELTWLSHSSYTPLYWPPESWGKRSWGRRGTQAWSFLNSCLTNTPLVTQPWSPIIVVTLIQNRAASQRVGSPPYYLNWHCKARPKASTTVPLVPRSRRHITLLMIRLCTNTTNNDAKNMHQSLVYKINIRILDIYHNILEKCSNSTHWYRYTCAINYNIII